MFRSILDDVIEIAKASGGDQQPRSFLQTVTRNASLRILAVQRAREFARSVRIPLANYFLRSVQTVLWAIEIDRDVTLGAGVFIVHPLGIVIGGDSRIGKRVRFYGNNTVGTIHDDGYPTIEDDVWIGAGARILGPVRIGAGARIGANAVVLTDVPPGHVAVGVPAHILPPRAARGPVLASPGASPGEPR